MPAIDQVREDLDYVASAVRREGSDRGPPAVYLLFAVIVAIGFALPDFAPRYAGWYWLVAGPLGGAVSWWLGYRQALREGVHDEALARRFAHHWLIAAAAFFLVFVPALTGAVSPAAAAVNVLLVGGLTYMLAGIHLDRPLLWSGLLMFGGYVALSLLALPYVWTATGIVVAASLLIAAVARPRAPSPRG
jgi:hypothetical protein